MLSCFLSSSSSCSELCVEAGTAIWRFSRGATAAPSKVSFNLRICSISLRPPSGNDFTLHDFKRSCFRSSSSRARTTSASDSRVISATVWMSGECISSMLMSWSLSWSSLPGLENETTVLETSNILFERSWISSGSTREWRELFPDDGDFTNPSWIVGKINQILTL